MGIMTDMRRRSSGFTLSEMLIVIALITLLASLSVPGLVALKRDLEVTELDEAAKSIFVAAQDRLTRLSRSGQLDTLQSGALVIGAKPSDCSEDAWHDGKFYYAKRGDDAAKLLLPLGSVDDSIRLNGDYIIEYDLQSGTVYSVFYSKKEILNYSKITSAGISYRADRNGRRRLKVGYYGGGGIERESFDKCDDPQLTVTNGNELKISITGQDADYSVSALLEDSHGHSAELTAVGSELVLDSMTTGNRFHEKYPLLTPGDNITVTVNFEKADCLPSSASVTVNSLFASVNEVGGNRTAEIGCARHLQNLDAAGGISGRLTANQTANIAIPNAFVSVSNDALELTYNGNKQKIAGLSGTNGVFVSLSGATLEDIYVVNAHIGGGDSVGMLAGSLTGCRVNGCRAYAYDGEPGFTVYPDYRITYSPIAGGLIGSASGCTVVNSFAALPALSGATAGGLIGSADGGTRVSNCYASCDLLDYDDLGGVGGMLIGTADISVDVSNCYAVGTSTGTPDFASDASVSGSYFVYSGDSGMLNSNTDLSSGTAIGADSTRPYDHKLDSIAYPYDAIPGLPHFGSWPVTITVYFTIDGTIPIDFSPLEYVSGTRLMDHADYPAVRSDMLDKLNLNEVFRSWVYYDADGAHDFAETSPVNMSLVLDAEYIIN